MALEFTYWLPPSAVKQSGKTRIAGPILPSWTSRAARSGTLSLKLFHATCARPEPVNPTRSNSTGKRRPRPRPAPESYWGGSQSASLRTCGSPRGLSLSTLEACSSVTTVPGFHLGRFSAMLACSSSRRSAYRLDAGVLQDLGHSHERVEQVVPGLFDDCGGQRLAQRLRDIGA